MDKVCVRDLVGVPYKVHGRGMDGMDCYGVVIEFMRRAGIDFPDVFYEAAGKDAGSSVREAVLDGFPVEKIGFPEYGCLVEIELHAGPHVGVCLDGGSFIHATRDKGVCVQNLARYGKSVRGFWRVIR